jgi:hypothetical protein
VLERGGRAVAGVEVKAAATVTAADFRGLRKSKEAAGPRVTAGVERHDGQTGAGFGDGTYAVPLRTLGGTGEPVRPLRLDANDGRCHRLQRVMLDLYDEARALVRALEAHAVEYALCGGLAMAVHGVPRATVDIDLLIAPGSLDRVRSLARELGYVFEAQPMSFAGGAVEMRRISKPDPEGGDVLRLDLLLVTPAIGHIWGQREQVRWEDGPLWVVTREGLIGLKSLRNSGTDQDDIRKLREPHDER